MFILDLYSELKNFTVYDLAQWLLSSSNWITNYKTPNNCSCNRGDIIMVDLGSNNFGYEASYEHPCVVLFENKNFVIIVPGSKGKYRNIRPFVIDCVNGFRYPTGLQLDQIRYISKSRIRRKLDKNVGSTTLNYIDSFIFKNYCGNKEFQVEKMVNNYQEIIKNKNKEVEELKNRLDELESKFISLQEQRADNKDITEQSSKTRVDM